MTPNLPGKRLANGRKAALECLDCMMAEEVNIQKLRVDFQAKFNLSPVAFFQKIVSPLITQSMLGETLSEGGTSEQAEKIQDWLRLANATMVGFDLDKSDIDSEGPDVSEGNGNGKNGDS